MTQLNEIPLNKEMCEALNLFGINYPETKVVSQAAFEELAKELQVKRNEAKKDFEKNGKVETQDTSKITISEEQRRLSKVCKKAIMDSKLNILLDWYSRIDSMTYTKFWKEFQITDFRISVNTVSIENIENTELKNRVSKMFKNKTHVYSKTDGIWFVLFDEKSELRLELSKKKIYECFGQINLLINSFGVKPEDVKLNYKASSLAASHAAKAIDHANKLLVEGKFGDFVTGTKQANRVVRKGTEIIKNRA